MASPFVVALNAQLLLLQSQMVTLLSQKVALNYGLDGESAQIASAIQMNFKLQKELADLIRVNSPYEIRTGVLVN